MSGGMSAQDVENCRAVIKLLTSDRYKDKNYMFLQPFDLTQTPGYMDVVSRVMDLSTLSANLDAGKYKSRNEFFPDCFLVFENAIAYHSTRETKWIAKLAKEMLKVAQRERKSLDKKDDGGKPKGGSGGGLLLPTKKNKKALSEAKREAGTKLKLKLGGGTAPKGSDSDPSAATAKPKVSIKLKGPPSQGKQPPPGVQQESMADEQKSKKPRLTLKLGKPKGTDEAAAAKTTTPKTSTPKTSTPKTSTPKTSSAKSSKVTGSGGSRGKELPKGVAPPKPEPAKKTTKKATSKATGGKATGSKASSAKSTSSKPTVTKSAAGTTKAKSTAKGKTKTKLTIKPTSTTPVTQSAPANRVMMFMTPDRRAQCAKVISGLKRRKHKTVGWFLQPVSDKAIVQDYRAKIPNPTDLSTMQSKLEKNEYKTIAEFALDFRRIFANCLRYNTSIKDSLRPVAVETLQTAEQLLAVFLAKPEAPTVVYPPLLFCWKLCLSVLDTLFNLTNQADGQMTALYFLFPVSFYCGGEFPSDYLEKVSKPMDFGSVTAKLIEGKYTSPSEFESDCKLVLENCMAYYGTQPDGKVYTEQANRLKVVLQQQLDALNRYIKSPTGQSAQRQAHAAVASVHFPKAPIPLLLGVIEELRALKYADKMTKITEAAMGPFEKPISVTAFPDYAQHVQSPMDMQTVEQKVKSASYATPEDFEYDVTLIFQNCITYNSARKTDHLVAMGKFALKSFRKIFSTKMRPFDDPSSVSTTKSMSPQVDTTRANPPDGAVSQGPAKKLKMEAGGVSRGKTAPRISLSSSQVTSATEKPASRPKTPQPKPASAPKSKPNQPVPLHIAIAKVKEQFPLRRAVKSLQSWEAACARFFKELMRHSWISAARPKFIFHVPVPVLFPELRDAYAEKVKKPMDLTTVECALLAGNRYTAPEDFVNDLALVFSNATVFNKDGRDIGDPLSCAYYDASIHLLRYCRWLSLELLSEFVEASDHVDASEVPGLPATGWKLTSGNSKKAREEMEVIVLKEPIERSLEGDRYTWMEAECEKLLKALRHQSDFRSMQFFIQPNYPPDYAAFIAKPMDWERVQKTLKKRQYDKFGDVIDDLRLIFSNALKYNARHAGTDSVSGRAYEAANYMSAKLETAINKLMLTVSDRVERERIDHNNAEREIEAAERAEEERIRAQWKTEAGKEGGGAPALRIESSQRIRSTKRTSTRENTDFEVPFFDDEDDGQHERSYFDVVRQQKAMFERQRQERLKMEQSTAAMASTVLLRMTQKDLAMKWVENERKKLGFTVPGTASRADPAQKNEEAKDLQNVAPSEILKKLEAKGRTPLQLKLAKPKAKKRRQRPALDFDAD